MEYLHTMVRVSNIDESLRFYCECLGLEEFSRKEYPEGKFTLIFLVAPGDAAHAKLNRAPLIELTYNWEPQTYTGGRNFGHLAFRVDNIYTTCQKLMDFGITLHRPPRDGHMAFVRSPDGISIELLQKGDPQPIRSPWKDMENIGTW